MNNTLNESLVYRDGTRNKLIRKSALSRIVLGTFSATSVCFLFSLAHAKWRNLHFSYIKNWLKGGLTFSFAFYAGNELLVSMTNFLNVYSNFWINYTLLAYLLSKVHYRYLIRNNQMKWYIAIKYSHKCFLYFLVANLIIELVLKISKEIILYKEEDLFDIVKDKFKDPVTHQPNFDMTYEDIEKHFMKSFHLFNSDEKIKILRKNLKAHTFDNEDINEGRMKSKNKKKSFMKMPVLKTVNLFDMYRNNKL